jgi:hypothetical protein
MATEHEAQPVENYDDENPLRDLVPFRIREGDRITSDGPATLWVYLSGGKMWLTGRAVASTDVVVRTKAGKLLRLATVKNSNVKG